MSHEAIQKNSSASGGHPTNISINCSLRWRKTLPFEPFCSVTILRASCRPYRSSQSPQDGSRRGRKMEMPRPPFRGGRLAKSLQKTANRLPQKRHGPSVLVPGQEPSPGIRCWLREMMIIRPRPRESCACEVLSRAGRGRPTKFLELLVAHNRPSFGLPGTEFQHWPAPDLVAGATVMYVCNMYHLLWRLPRPYPAVEE